MSRIKRELCKICNKNEYSSILIPCCFDCWDDIPYYITDISQSIKYIKMKNRKIDIGD